MISFYIYYFFINEKSRIFINGALVVDINFGSSLVDLDLYYDLEMQSRNGFAFGLGIAQNNKYNVELRYHLNREVLHNYLYWGSDYNTLSLIFGYTIF